jgi:hypothetical protein
VAGIASVKLSRPLSRHHRRVRISRHASRCRRARHPERFLYVAESGCGDDDCRRAHGRDDS